MSILDERTSAAYDPERGRLDELTPVARNFTIVRDIPITGSNFFTIYRVFSYVAHVCKTFENELLVLVKRDALYKPCKPENAPRLVDVSQFINMREVA